MKVLDAGYYGLNAVGGLPSADTNLVCSPDTVYLLMPKPTYSVPPALVERLRAEGDVAEFGDGEHAGKGPVLFRPGKGANPVLPDAQERDALEEIKTIYCTPTPTQLMTLEVGLAQHAKDARVSVMVKDLGLPAGLGRHLDMLLPEAYQRLFAEHHVDAPMLISERICRNTGWKMLDKRLEKGSGDGPFEVTRREVEAAESCTVGGHCGGETVNITSRGIRQHSSGLKGCSGSREVGLLRPGKHEHEQVPSCGVIIAGQLRQLIDRGCTELISISHKADDPEIARKLFDGCAVASWLMPGKDLLCRSILLVSPRSQYEKRKAESRSEPAFSLVQTHSLLSLRGEHDPRIYERRPH